MSWTNISKPTNTSWTAITKAASTSWSKASTNTPTAWSKITKSSGTGWTNITKTSATTAILTANPSLNGYVERSVGRTVGESFTTMHSSAGNFSESTAGPVWVSTAFPQDKWWFFDRSILLFDTSALAAADSITSATLQVYVTNNDTSLANLNALVVSSSPASNTALVDADYSQLGSSALSNLVSVGGLMINAYNTFTLNSTGLAALTGTISKLGLMIDNDRTNTSPTWASGVSTGFDFDTTTNLPILTVNYTTKGWTKLPKS